MDETTVKLAGAIEDRYRIERELGAGGMARVYLARDLKHDRPVAIKVMRPELAASLGAERFLREIRLLARLQHPHILGLVDSGETGGLLYYVMPYLAGDSLRARLDRGGELPVEDAIRMLREIAGALAHAHEQGVVHRDIKPENVLFSGEHVQVSDFGIARMVGEADAGTAITTAGMVIGSPRYMSPEQVTADPRTDHRADLYAFGALAYEMLAGIPPFSAGSPAELMKMHLKDEPTPLAKRRPAIPAALDDLVLRCLRKRPADRWQSARDILARLDRIAAGEDSGSRHAHLVGTVTAHFPITGALASRVNREYFDPRMIGAAIEYLDNLVESDVLVMLFNAAWFDGSDLEPHLRQLPYRCVTPTLLGFEQRARRRFELSLNDHIVLLAGLLRAKIEEVRPSRVLLAGFSSAGDLVLHMAAQSHEGVPPPDGVLVLGGNQAMETCFGSRVLARLDANHPAQLMQDLRSVLDVATNLDEWIIVNGYLSRIMVNFRSDLRPLRSLARAIVEPFEKDDRGAFAKMYREASARARLVRCVFEDSEVCNRLLKATLLDHMDRGVLGDRYRDGSLIIEPTNSHFELIQPERVAKHLAEMVQELSEMESQSAP